MILGKENSNESSLIKYNSYENVRLVALGSGSDYTVFLDHLGIPSINLGLVRVMVFIIPAMTLIGFSPNTATLVLCTG